MTTQSQCNELLRWVFAEAWKTQGRHRDKPKLLTTYPYQPDCLCVSLCVLWADATGCVSVLPVCLRPCCYQCDLHDVWRESWPDCDAITVPGPACCVLLCLIIGASHSHTQSVGVIYPRSPVCRSLQCHTHRNHPGLDSLCLSYRLQPIPDCLSQHLSHPTNR
jgi:hypothetical protein